MPPLFVNLLNPVKRFGDTTKKVGSLFVNTLGDALSTKVTAENVLPPQVDETKEKIDAVLAGLAYNESRGVENPYTFNKPSGVKEYGNDLGKYQVTEATLKRLAKRYLGREVTTQEFLNSPQLQEEFMRNRVRAQINMGYTPQQIADFHRSGKIGEPGDTTYNSPDYVKSFDTEYKRIFKSRLN